MARKTKKVGVACAKFTTTAFYILTCNFITVHGLSITICTRMYLYVEISQIALLSVYLQPVMCYGTAKRLIMCFQRHKIYIIFIGKIFMEAIQTQQLFLFHIISTCCSTFGQNLVMVSCLLLKLEPSKVVLFSREL